MNGVLVVNKEKGYTSRDVVNIVSKILNTKKVGHTGTLDPIAEGVLVLTIGKCTKLGSLLTSSYKEYIAEFEIGYETDTLDNTGEVIKKSDKIVLQGDIEKIIESFKGVYNQEVPKYSAVKINGKKLYEYARNNEEVSLPKREVDIKELDILSINNNIIKIRCLVSKGTYIRSLIRDIGVSLGTYATMTSLVRTKLGDYSIEESYSLDDIKNNNYKLISVEEIFNNYPKVDMDDELYKKVINGVVLDNIYNSLYVLFYYKDKLVCIYKEYEKSKIKMFVLL